MSKRRSLKELVDEFGWDTAKRLMERFGGDKIYIPKLTSAVITRRNAALIEDYDQGMSYKALAEKYGVTEANARLIVSRRNVVPIDQSVE